MTNRFSWVLAFGLMASLPFGPAHAPQDPVVKQLATERHNAAKAVWERLSSVPCETLQDCDSRATWSRRLAESASESGALTTREAFAQHLARMQDMLVATKELYQAGRRTSEPIALLEYHVSEAKGLAQR